MEQLWQNVNLYGFLSEAAKRALSLQVKERIVAKQDYFVREGYIPSTIGFVQKGLLAYYSTFDNGDMIIKKFFPEHTFVGATSALIQNNSSQISILALEETILYEFPFKA